MVESRGVGLGIDENGGIELEMWQNLISGGFLPKNSVLTFPDVNIWMAERLHAKLKFWTPPQVLS